MSRKTQPLRTAAEKHLAGNSGTATVPRSAGDLLHELQVHQIELEMQNEALRHIQMELEASRDRYVDLYEFAPVGYLTLTRSGEIVEINLTAVTLLGGERRKLLASRFLNFVVSDHHERWQSCFLHAFAHDGRQTCEISLQRPDGTDFSAHLDCLLTAGPALRISLSDISERKKVENELYESEMRWQFAVESHGDAMWDWDAKQDELFLTAAAKELFNLPDCGLKRPIADLLARIHDEDRSLVQGWIDDLIRGKTSEWSGDCRLQGSAETPRWIATSGRVMKRSADGRPHRIVSISRDVTLRNLREAEERRQRDLVSHQGRLVLLGELASALAHEINQPLTAITGFASACARKAAAMPDVLELARAIEEQAMRAGDIAWRMRGFARRQHLGRSPISLHEVAAGVAKWLQMDSAHLEAIVDITGVGSSLPQVDADRVEIEQVLVNLVRNGLEAGPANVQGKRIAIAGYPGERSDEIEISITDWGSGLSPTMDLNAFQPFVSSKEQGLGLGLTVCISIIEGHGGRLWASPNPEGGTIFHFTLPIAGAREQAQAETRQ